ncbi:MAG TPA: hypothetical protein VKA01_08150 [Vicinamibacteria bacterium]|nr:hypothetical protein [Vicinamibacteria bacterium]
MTRCVAPLFLGAALPAPAAAAPQPVSVLITGARVPAEPLGILALGPR